MRTRQLYTPTKLHLSTPQYRASPAPGDIIRTKRSAYLVQAVRPSKAEPAFPGWKRVNLDVIRWPFDDPGDPGTRIIPMDWLPRKKKARRR